MATTAFPEWNNDEILAALPEFLDIYAQELGKHCRPFDGIPELLDALEAQGSRWGIVTNKPEYLARDLMPLLGWDARCAVLIGGDSLAERKPHPLPLQVAAQRIGMAPEHCVYVGDDERDIQAARAAGMPSVAALWGYRLENDDPQAWLADKVVATPAALLQREAWPFK